MLLKQYIENHKDEILTKHWQSLFLNSIIQNDIFKITFDEQDYLYLNGESLDIFNAEQIQMGWKKISKKIRKFYKKSRTIN